MAIPIITFDKNKILSTQKQTMPDNRKKNLGLTQSEFLHLVQELKNGNEQLIKEHFLAHFKECTNKLISFNGATDIQAHESTLDALLEIREYLKKDKIQYGNLCYYFEQNARMKFSKLINRQSEKLRIENIEDMDFQNSTDSSTNLLEEFQTKKMTTLVRKVLKDFCNDCLELLEQHYLEGLTFVEIAQIEDKKPNTIRQRAKRCREKLQANLKKVLPNHKFNNPKK